MIDFHCHLLAQIDDGAQSVEESLKILNELAEQKVTCVCATPHFNGDEEDIETFLKKRQTAYERMEQYIPKNIKVILGAEVLITPQLLKMENPKLLCMENTNIILLEMPFSPWQKWMFDAVDKLENAGLTVLIAHPERYYESKSLFKYRYFLKKEKVFMQFNADSFLKLKDRRAVKRILKNKNIVFVLGSDAHGIKRRKPKVDKAMRRLAVFFGAKTYKKLIDSSKMLFRESTIRQVISEDTEK